MENSPTGEYSEFRPYDAKLIVFADFLTWYENSADSAFGTIVRNAEFRPYEVAPRKFRDVWNKRRELKGRAILQYRGSKMFFKNRRMGNFQVTAKLIDENPKALMGLIFSKMIILRATLEPWDIIRYTALCDDFAEVREGEIVPEYEFIFHKKNGVFAKPEIRQVNKPHLV